LAWLNGQREVEVDLASGSGPALGGCVEALLRFGIVKTDREVMGSGGGAGRDCDLILIDYLLAREPFGRRVLAANRHAISPGGLILTRVDQVGEDGVIRRDGPTCLP